MQDDEKVYYPEVIEPNPFPGGEEVGGGNYTVTTKNINGEQVVTQQRYKPRSFPKHLLAHETIGQALNTRSRKILSEFELIEQGAFRVGKHQPGVSGEIAITPEGITALNAAGIRTFAIDAETGSPVFAGEIFGGSININNQFEVDEEGNVIARSIALVESQFSSDTGTNIEIDSTSYEDIPDTTLTLSVVRPTIVVYLFGATVTVQQNPGAAGQWSARGIVRIRRTRGVTSNEVGSLIAEGERSSGGDIFGLTKRTTLGTHYIEILQPGDYTFKLVSKLEDKLNNGVFQIFDATLTVLTFGTALT